MESSGDIVRRGRAACWSISVEETMQTVEIEGRPIALICGEREEAEAYFTGEEFAKNEEYSLKILRILVLHTIQRAQG